MVIKQLFFDPKLAQTNCFPYNTAEIQDINLNLSKNNFNISIPENLISRALTLDG